MISYSHFYHRRNFFLLLLRLGLLVCITLLSCFSQADGHSPLKITGEAIEVLIDQTHKHTFNSLIRNQDLPWKKVEDSIPSFGFSSHTYWFRFHIPPHNKSRLLELDYALLDEISFYRVRDDQIIDSIFTGDQRYFSERPIQHRAFLFPIPSSDETQTIYLKVRSSSSIQIPLTLWPDQSFFEQDQYRFAEHGLYYGIVLVMALYNLFLFLRLRDSAYIFYVIYVLTFALTQLSLTGFAYQFIWPNLPEWNEKSLAVLTPLIIVCGLFFSSDFLKLETYHPMLYKFLTGQIVLGLIISALSVVYPYHQMMPYGAGLAIISCLSILLTSYFVMLRGLRKYAIYFALAWSVFLIGTVILAMNKFGIVPRTGLTESAAQIGSAIEMILLSFALAERLYDAMKRQLIAEKNSIEIQDELILTQQQQNEELEHQVSARTQELAAALEKVQTLNDELSHLSTIDQLTGVRNRRYFDDMLDREYRRALRNRTNLSLLMIDLDHFKNVNDTYGHQAGDLCLKIAANAIYNVVKRPPDLVCRYGGEELAVILPETDQQGASLIAERIRHQIEILSIQYANQTIHLTTSVGSASISSNNQKTLSLLIELADKALYKAKQDGRNCCRRHDDIHGLV